MKELEVTRKRGYALEIEELALGRACIAAPVRDKSGKVVAGISLSGLKSGWKNGSKSWQAS
ncbi:IclR family transcriptional regulator domain-containing protein [Sediminibacillus halophilus]|uniref:IclR family transcriptional regulator domain-containing protein n=1 Tax=Sediminibacillus halophilus TaxID=482461 RepID=UPI0009F508E7